MSVAAAFDDAGWCRIASDLAPEVLSALSEAIPASDDGAGSRRLLDRPACAALVAPLRSRLVGLGLLAADAVAVQCTSFRKSAACNWKVPYHQDLSVPVIERIEHSALGGWSVKEDGVYVQPLLPLLDELLAVRLHLDPCDADAGALRVMPRSHRLGRLSPSAIAALDKRRQEVVCDAEAGDLLLMRPLLLHASSRARRPNGRRVLHFLFAPPDPGCGLRWRVAL